MNFRELRNRLISSLWDYIGCPVILSNQVQPEAEPPFCIYTVTAPYIPDGGMGDYEIADVAEGVKISRMEMPSATFSFTFCSQNRTAENGSAVNGEDEAWAVADKAISYFKHAGQDDFLALGVAVVDVGQAQDRTTLLVDEAARPNKTILPDDIFTEHLFLREKGSGTRNILDCQQQLQKLL